jgi:hypothetical protein
MKKLIEKIENTFSAVAFAEQAEWDDAINMAEGSSRPPAIEKKQPHKEAERKRTPDSRPRLRV